MILTKYDILQEIALKNIIVQPFDAAQLNPNSYDVLLGNHFFLLRYHGLEPYFYGPVEVPDGNPLLLPAGETILAMTKEVVGANEDIVAQIRAKSSTRRLGVSICDDAGLGDIGYIDHWTLELTANVQPYAVVTAGAPIGQIVFHAAGCARPPRSISEPYIPPAMASYSGQYQRGWPENMVPRRYEGHIIPVTVAYSPYIFWAMAAQPDSPRKLEPIVG